MTEYLATQEPESVDRYVLLDSVDWMDAQMLTELWEEIRRTARPGARVIFRTAGARSPLSTQVPPALLDGWRYHEAESKRYLEQDRSAIYGGFHLYSRTE
jgi:S-adenosylmethionine-diacylglycerol 3-amino-3-carboxypropyl transferase